MPVGDALHGGESHPNAGFPKLPEAELSQRIAALV
jgi:hypothetical protein